MWKNFRLDFYQLSRLTASGARNLEGLGALADGMLTPAGVAAISNSVQPMPPWVGFAAQQWPGAIVDGPRLPKPSEVRRLMLPTLDMVDVLVDEVAVALGSGKGIALMAGVREIAEEILINAVAHRDYSIDEPITVDQYTDAVRVTSPGSPAHARIDNGAFDGRGARNPSLQFLLLGLGRGRLQGIGWARCSFLAASVGLDVTAAIHDDQTVVTVQIAPAKRVRLEASEGQDRRLRVPEGTWEHRVLALLEDKASWRPKDIQEALNIPRSTLTKVLRRLSQRGEIERGMLSARSSKQTWRRSYSSSSSK